MREVHGTLAFGYSPNDAYVILVGHRELYVFDKGLELDVAIDAGSEVGITLIRVPGPNPANSYKAHFEVERIASMRVLRLPAVASCSLPMKLQLVG